MHPIQDNSTQGTSRRRQETDGRQSGSQETGRVAASGQRALKNLNCRQSSLIQGHLTTLMLSQSHHKTEPGEKAHELAWVKIAGIQMCVCTCVYAFVCYVDVHPAKSRREWADAW